MPKQQTQSDEHQGQGKTHKKPNMAETDETRQHENQQVFHEVDEALLLFRVELPGNIFPMTLSLALASLLVGLPRIVFVASFRFRLFFLFELDRF